MIQVAGSPLPALIGYYERLAADPNQKVAELGFSAAKVHFEVILERDGTFVELADIRAENPRGKGKSVPRTMLVPDAGGRAGTGLKPFFCWDNTGYALGRDNKGNPERAAEMFAAFRDLHLGFRDELVDDEGFRALCLFLEKQWDPGQAESLPSWDEAVGMNVVFRLRAGKDYVHQSKAVKAAWSRRLAAESAAGGGVSGFSLISGDRERIARLHPLLSGVIGANTMGAAIVSFNIPSFESYGKSQSYNAPVGEIDAFRYTTALGRLLADDDRRVSIGDATVVFWSDRGDAAKMEEIAREFCAGPPPKSEAAEHGETINRLRSFLEAARKGRLADELGNPEAPFYVLGLSPNSSRLSVRFWIAGTVRQFAERLARHARDLEMVGARPDDPPLSVRRLIAEAMPKGMTSSSQKKYVAQLAGDFSRSVLGGYPYPQAMLNALVRRVRSDATINHARAAMLKAYLNRNLGNRQKEVPVALDTNHPDEAYHLGRLFAVLEKTQEESLAGEPRNEAKATQKNTADSGKDGPPREKRRTIKDSYFSGASATPASIYPRLLRLHQHHMNKIENTGRRVNLEKLIGEICSHIRRFPAHLPLEKQGLLQIGYYHQRQDLFTSKKTENEKETANV